MTMNHKANLNSREECNRLFKYYYLKNKRVKRMETVRRIFPNENADFYQDMVRGLGNKKAHQWLDESEVIKK